MKSCLWIFAALCLALAAAIPAMAQDQGAREPVAILDTTQGEIVLRFFPDLAPKHVESFLAHCQSGYYTDTTFHRVIPGFMIQGGDPNSKDDDPHNDGYGGYSSAGPGTNLPAEFSDRHHGRGILSMARSTDPNSAGSQFFICVADANMLDGQYSVFGQVVTGMDVVDAIVNVPRDANDRPLEAQRITGVRVEEWPVELIEATMATGE